MSDIVTRARPPTATQYVNGERDSTRKRTDALHSRGESRRGKRVLRAGRKPKRRPTPDLGRLRLGLLVLGLGRRALGLRLGLRLRRGRRGLARLLLRALRPARGLAIVGLVEAAAFEDDADGGEHLAQRSSARGALG